MPEFPEVAILARQMNDELVGKTITGVEVLQPKCLNVSKKTFTRSLTGERIRSVAQRGKWMLVETTQGWLLLCLGMGGEILLVTRKTLPDKHRLIFDFARGACLAVNFWWFGYAHYARPDRLDRHVMTAKLGPNALDVTANDLRDMLTGRRGQVKAWLLDQSRLAGIGNFYIHDILFRAGLHPLRPIATLAESDVSRLHQAIHTTLRQSLDKHGAAYEMDLYGHKGGYGMDDILVGYKEGQPCPTCGALVEKIRTGGTSSFICPCCQPLGV